MTATQEYLGIGIYGVPDASRFTGMSAPQIRRWINGYHYKSGPGSQKRSHEILNRQLPIIDGQTALGFLDLIEIRVIAALLKAEFSLHAIRKAHALAEVRNLG